MTTDGRDAAATTAIGDPQPIGGAAQAQGRQPVAHFVHDFSRLATMDPRATSILGTTLVALTLWSAPAGSLAPASTPQPWVEPMDCDSLAAIPPRGNIDYALIQGIWNTHCTGCHTGTAPGAGIAGLSLHPDVSYDRIVNVPSSQVPTLLRVFPGDPLRSWIFYKINCDVPGFGSRMPLGGRLSEIEQAAIFDWIQNRAPREAIFIGRFEGRF